MWMVVCMCCANKCVQAAHICGTTVADAQIDVPMHSDISYVMTLNAVPTILSHVLGSISTDLSTAVAMIHHAVVAP